MYFADIKFKSGCKIELHFYNYEEVNDWFKVYLIQYLMKGIADIRIYYKTLEEEI